MQKQTAVPKRIQTKKAAQYLSDMEPETEVYDMQVHEQTGKNGNEIAQGGRSQMNIIPMKPIFVQRKPEQDSEVESPLPPANNFINTKLGNPGNQILKAPDEEKDPWKIMEDKSFNAVSMIIIDRKSMRTRFFTVDGKTLDGILTTLTSTFSEGEYLLERNYGPDPGRFWNVSLPDGKKYLGGLQFTVLMNEGIDFNDIGYTKPVSLSVASGVLPKLIDLDKRIKDIKKIASQMRVDTKDEEKIIALLADIPAEQSAEFMEKMNEETVDGVPLLDRLDSVVDIDENMLLHQALTQLRLRAKPDSGISDLSKAPMLAWHDVMGFFEQSSTFTMERLPNGKIRVRYMGAISSGLFSDPDYDEVKDMNFSTRLNWMAGGVELDPNQPIIIHDYDRDKYIVLTAQDIIAYKHSGTRKFIEDSLLIASFATPIGAETVVGRAAAIAFERVLPALVLLADENKLNIKKWFPNWGPKMLQTIEIVRIGIGIYGAAQFLRSSYMIIKRLKEIRNSRKLLDAAIHADDAEELAKAEKVASQMEQQADDLLAKANKAGKEMGIPVEAAAAESALSQVAKGASELEQPAVKSSVLEGAINNKSFNDPSFTKLVNKELTNPRIRLSTQPGYDVEVAIEGTEHFLARKPDGTWCLFSGTPKGCGVIAVAEDLDLMFAQITAELKLSPPKIGSKGKVDISKAITDAKEAGFIGAKGEPLGVDLIVQPHSSASDTRAALGVSGQDVQSAHVGPTAALNNKAGYSRSGALTVLMPKGMHKQFDDQWKAYSIAQRQKGITQVTVDNFLGVMAKSIDDIPNLSRKTKDAMAGLLFQEFTALGLKPGDLITLPYPNIK